MKAEKGAHLYRCSLHDRMNHFASAACPILPTAFTSLSLPNDTTPPFFALPSEVRLVRAFRLLLCSPSCPNLPSEAHKPHLRKLISSAFDRRSSVL